MIQSQNVPTLGKTMRFFLGNIHKKVCLQELVFGFLLFGKGVFPLCDAADLSRHEGEVAQGFHSHVGVGHFAEALALPDINGHHGGIVVLHPLNVSGVAVHRHHQAVAVGDKMSHLCCKQETKGGKAVGTFVADKRTERGWRSLTVFGVIVGKCGGVVGVGGVPAQLSALCVIHGDGVFYREGGKPLNAAGTGGVGVLGGELEVNKGLDEMRTLVNAKQTAVLRSQIRAAVYGL